MLSRHNENDKLKKGRKKSNFILLSQKPSILKSVTKWYFFRRDVSRGWSTSMGCSPGGTNELRPEEICLYKNGPELIAPGPGLLK